ncbi:gluconate kinase, partial [Bacillus wiedmannii]
METRGRVIGIDIGTTSTKTVVFTEKGKVVASHAVDYPIIQPKVGWAEQDPDVICAAVYKTVSVAIERGNVLPEDIASIGISTAMHALIAVDENGAPLTRSIIWADNRSTKQSEKLLQHMNGHDIYRRTGTPIHPMSPLSKLLWMKEEEPELYASAYKFISIKEYVIYQLFSRYVVDYRRRIRST